MGEIAQSLERVRAQVAAAFVKSVKAGLLQEKKISPCLVAVSKTKSVEEILLAYQAGQRHFGENYVQEIATKAPSLPQDIKWHFIGHLQSNKVKQLIDAVPNLYVIETVDSLKLSRKISNVCSDMGRDALRIMIQVNTSGESSKFGVSPEESEILARSIKESCANLTLQGLMTIGRDSGDNGEAFEGLNQCRERVSKALGVEPSALDLSMGMSGDFEEAIMCGSTNVRIGSLIFGQRTYPKPNQS